MPEKQDLPSNYCAQTCLPQNVGASRPVTETAQTRDLSKTSDIVTDIKLTVAEISGFSLKNHVAIVKKLET